MGDSLKWGAEQEAEAAESRRNYRIKLRRDKILTLLRLSELSEEHLDLIELVVNLKPAHVTRVRTYVRNQEAVAEIARLIRMFNQGSFE